MSSLIIVVNNHCVNSKGWTSAYKIEGAIMQVAVHLSSIKAYVATSDPKKVAELYSLKNAEEGYEHFATRHKEWFKKPE